MSSILHLKKHPHHLVKVGNIQYLSVVELKDLLRTGNLIHHKVFVIQWSFIEIIVSLVMVITVNMTHLQINDQLDLLQTYHNLHHQILQKFILYLHHIQFNINYSLDSMPNHRNYTLRSYQIYSHHHLCHS